jgi:hypothetical protein
LDGDDAGGQLTNSNPSGGDIHQIHLCKFKLEPNDIVYIGSDGVVDNLDPSVNLISPENVAVSLDKETSIKDKEWQLKNELHVNLATKASTVRFAEIIQGCKSGKDISEKMNEFLEVNTSEVKTAFLTKYRAKSDQYQGKMDDAASAFFEYHPNEK